MKTNKIITLTMALLLLSSCSDKMFNANQNERDSYRNKNEFEPIKDTSIPKLIYHSHSEPLSSEEKSKDIFVEFDFNKNTVITCEDMKCEKIISKVENRFEEWEIEKVSDILSQISIKQNEVLCEKKPAVDSSEIFIFIEDHPMVSLSINGCLNDTEEIVVKDIFGLDLIEFVENRLEINTSTVNNNKEFPNPLSDMENNKLFLSNNSFGVNSSQDACETIRPFRNFLMGKILGFTDAISICNSDIRFISRISHDNGYMVATFDYTLSLNVLLNLPEKTTFQQTKRTRLNQFLLNSTFEIVTVSGSKFVHRKVHLDTYSIDKNGSLNYELSNRVIDQLLDIF